MDTSKYLRRIEIAQTKYEQETSEISQHIMEDIIIPFCDKQKLAFHTGEWGYFFQGC